MLAGGKNIVVISAYTSTGLFHTHKTNWLPSCVNLEVKKVAYLLI